MPNLNVARWLMGLWFAARPETFDAMVEAHDLGYLIALRHYASSKEISMACAFPIGGGQKCGKPKDDWRHQPHQTTHYEYHEFQPAEKATIDVGTRTIHVRNFDFHYTEGAFVNPSTYDFHHRVWRMRSPKATVIHNAGYVVAIVFPEYFDYSEQDALDAAADSGKLDFLQVSPTEMDDYKTGADSEGNLEYGGIINLGNAGEPFDQEGLEYFTVPVALFAQDPVIAKVIAENSEDR
jgi:hypothetical protein